MADKIHDQNLSAKLDAFFDAGRDLARGLLYAWLARSGDHQAGDQDRAETSRETRPAQGDDIELLTTKELARRISYSTRQIQTFKLEGMPHTGEGRRTRFKLQEVVAWLDQRQRTHHENNRISIVSNGKVPSAPIKTRLRAAKRI